MDGGAGQEAGRARVDGAPDFSVVLPVFNEEGNLREVHRRLTAVLPSLGTYEIVFVDDGSRDGSWGLIREIASGDPHVRGLRFSRNFGHHVALTAGLDAAQGRFVVTMDADLQDQPEEIPNLYQKLREGYDSVFGVREVKRFPWFKRASSALFNGVMRRLAPTPYPINTNVFRIMNRPFLDAFRRFRESDRFITGLFAVVGFRQAGVVVVHGERHAGKTKYDLRRMLRLAANGLLGFSRAPLKAPLWIGLATGAAFVACAAWTGAQGLGGAGVEGWVWVLLAVLGLSSLQSLALAVVAAYVERIHAQSLGRPLYLIQETTPHLQTGEALNPRTAGPTGPLPETCDDPRPL